MKHYLIYILFLATSCKVVKPFASSQFDSLSNPIRVGNLLCNRFLEQPHSQYGSPLRIKEPRTQITYPDVCIWLGGLWFAEATKNIALQNRFENRYRKVVNDEKQLLPKPNHVDNTVFGSVPLELFKLKGDSSYYNLGMQYANSQWELPTDEATKKTLTPIQIDRSKRGYSWQTRIWLDDMFMITAIQGQAYRVTKNPEYINRIAKEMVLYLDSIQTPNGLFYHSTTAPFYWARGNGWLAVGMTEVLRVIPENNIYRPRIMAAYQKMMQSLLSMQGDDGMWNQLVNKKEAWKETSGSAMFTYAMIVGSKKGWLDKRVYEKAALKAWNTLVTYLEPNGDIRDVCEGTNIGTTKEHYLRRLKLTGDFHGQAPMIWCAYALTSKL